MDAPHYRSRTYAIESNRERLLAVVAELFVMIGLTAGGMVERVPRPLYRKAHRLLRKAESCARRLIVSAARAMAVESAPPVPAGRSGESQDKAQGEANRGATANRQRRPLFNLFDRPRRKDWAIPGRRPRKRSKIEPRIHVFGDPRIPAFLRPQAQAPVTGNAGPLDDGSVSALRLCRRIIALADALADIPRHARRFLRWERKPIEKRRPSRASPFRVGRPPGWRIRATHEVDEILKNCHWLVNETRFDTS